MGNIFFTGLIFQNILLMPLFCKDSFSIEIISDIVRYRIKKNIEDDTDQKLDFSSCFETLKGYRNGSESMAELISSIETVIPSDQLLTLLKKL